MPLDSVLIGTTTSQNSAKDYGNWITGYTNPKPGRYHSGMKAQLSPAGLILAMFAAETVRQLPADTARRVDCRDDDRF
jgi:hypothetical protein